MKKNIFDKNGKYLPGLESHVEEENKDKRLLLIQERENQIRYLDEAKEASNSTIEEEPTNKESSTHSNNDEHGHSEQAEILETIYFSNNEILLFASVISATDAVAALAFVKEESDPKLFPILFGEGVVNDAVCIVLYQIIKTFLASGQRKQYIYIYYINLQPSLSLHLLK